MTLTELRNCMKTKIYLINKMILQVPVIPSQNLRQLMPATHMPAAKVTKEKNKLVIVQQGKKH